jgi:hypothetical protein
MVLKRATGENPIAWTRSEDVPRRDAPRTVALAISSATAAVAGMARAKSNSRRLGVRSDRSGPTSPAARAPFMERGRVMAEFIEVPIEREDGSEGLHYVNIEAISYVDSQTPPKGGGLTLTVHLDDGYWFTLSGPKADEIMHLIKDRMCIHFKNDASDN